MARLTSTVASRAGARASTALIFDTNASSRESLCKLLGECQIRTIGVSDSIAAREALRSEAIDILICEDLGGLLGIEMLEMCAALFPNVRRVYLARTASSELHAEAIARGHVHASVVDAMNPIEMRDTIARLVRP